MMTKTLGVLLALAAALPCAAADWKQIRRNDRTMLSMDPDSVVRKGDVVSVRYMVDFRIPPDNSPGAPQYRSIVVNAKVDCKKRRMAILHTDAFALYGGRGPAIAQSKPTKAESGFKPLEKGSSDEDVFKNLCEEPAAAAKPAAASQPAAPKPAEASKPAAAPKK